MITLSMLILCNNERIWQNSTPRSPFSLPEHKVPMVSYVTDHCPFSFVMHCPSCDVGQHFHLNISFSDIAHLILIKLPGMTIGVFSSIVIKTAVCNAYVCHAIRTMVWSGNFQNISSLFSELHAQYVCVGKL